VATVATAADANTQTVTCHSLHESANAIAANAPPDGDAHPHRHSPLGGFTHSRSPPDRRPHPVQPPDGVPDSDGRDRQKMRHCH